MPLLEYNIGKIDEGGGIVRHLNDQRFKRRPRSNQIAALNAVANVLTQQVWISWQFFLIHPPIIAWNYKKLAFGRIGEIPGYDL